MRTPEIEEERLARRVADRVGEIMRSGGVTHAEYLSPEAAARFLGFSIRTIEGWRQHGGGPRCTRIGRTVRYRVRDLVAFMDANSEEAADATAE